MVILQYTKDIYPPVPKHCEHCGEGFLQLIRYDESTDSQIRALAEDISCLRGRLYDLEIGDELIDGRDFTVKH